MAVSKPNVRISIPDGSLYAGTNLELSCNSSFSTAVDNDDLDQINVSWFNGSTGISNKTDRLTVSTLSGIRQLSFISTLIISPLFDVDNNATFKCQASANSDSEFVGPSEIGEGSVSVFVLQRSELNLLK